MYTIPDWLQVFLAGRSVDHDQAPISILEIAWRQIVDACQMRKPLMLSLEKVAYVIGNSIVFSAPQVEVEKLFPGSEHIRVVQTIVALWGEDYSDPHTHNSHVLVYILYGAGWLDYWPEGPQAETRERIHVKAGDFLCVPIGVWHHLNCPIGQIMATMGIEIGANEDLYYQQNQYVDQ